MKTKVCFVLLYAVQMFASDTELSARISSMDHGVVDYVQRPELHPDYPKCYTRGVYYHDHGCGSSGAGAFWEQQQAIVAGEEIERWEQGFGKVIREQQQKNRDALLKKYLDQRHSEDPLKGALLFVLHKLDKLPRDQYEELTVNHYFLKSLQKDDKKFVCGLGCKKYTYQNKSDIPKLSKFTGLLSGNNSSSCVEIDAVRHETVTLAEAQQKYPDFGWPKE